MPAPREHGIAMWGPPGSGKSTFLAALGIAIASQNGRWSLTGQDPASTEMLISSTGRLAEGSFPAATAGLEMFSWVLEETRPPAVRRRWPRRDPAPGPPARVRLRLVDPAGEIYAPEGSRYAREDLVTTLESSRGIVFLFDPIREFLRGDAFEHTFGMLATLASRMVDSPERIGGRLPHHVAVCVTKFDEPRVLQTAMALDLLTADPADDLGSPTVAEDDARELLGRLCQVSHSGNADLVVNTLLAHFLPSRVKFFITSSIGFYVAPRSGGFDFADYQNVLPGGPGAGESRVRTAVRPVNVVEPVFWLARQLAEA
ncbi:MAG TPA: hypothetical protein VK586_14770 [Streptosporangiaceae bacterium]|nr:hypothetical protein [Streptosporangiaceae bacterium]